jgi:cellulose biosynthesis protein BcsQ
MEKYTRKILEADSQNSISDWLEERPNELKSLSVKVEKFDPFSEMDEVMEEMKKKCDILFIDFPGESISSKLTKSGLAYSDLCIIPIRPSDKAIRAFENNLLPIIKQVNEIRGGNQYVYLLPTFAHPSANLDSYRKIFEPYKEDVNICQNVHIDRNVFTYFSSGGLSLGEYYQSIKSNKREAKTVKKAISEVDAIANEVLQILNNL